jgi:hypothetical protein
MIEGAALPFLEDMRVVDTAGPSRVTMAHGGHSGFEPDEPVYSNSPSSGGALILSDDSSGRRDVIAYKAERGESEIIALPCSGSKPLRGSGTKPDWTRSQLASRCEAQDNRLASCAWT